MTFMDIPEAIPAAESLRCRDYYQAAEIRSNNNYY